MRQLFPSDLIPLEVTSEEVQRVFSLLTPQDVLDNPPATPPALISPEEVIDYPALFARREEVRTLRLVPLKSREMYAHYHTYSIEQLTYDVKKELGDHAFMFAENKFPYFLPSEVYQFVLWIGHDCTIPKLANVLAHILKALSLSPEQVILFERPIGITTKYVRGTIPAIRHVHFWFHM